jgi:glycosyltransferase involved in cell wall biosynthesis
MLKISVIMPVYNGQEHLKEAMDSVFGQTYENFEFIVIDDQSTDDTLSIIESYQDERIILCSTDGIGKGRGVARNVGLQKATGDIIVLQDADDISLLDRFQRLIEGFEKNPDIDIISSAMKIIGSEQITHSINDPSHLPYENIIFNPTASWRREKLDGITYDDSLNESEDYDFWIKAWKKRCSFGYIQDALIRYRTGSANKEVLIERTKNCQNIQKANNFQPMISIVENTNFDENALLLSGFSSFEIVESINSVNGKYIAFAGLTDDVARYRTQFNFLEKNPEIIGCGSFITTPTGYFFHPQESHIIEDQLIKGHIPVEKRSFMFRNVSSLYNNDHFYKLLVELTQYGKIINLTQKLVLSKEEYNGDSKRYPEVAEYARKNLKVINVIQMNIRSRDGFSGVDRYIKTLCEEFPTYIRTYRIDFNVSEDVDFKIVPSGSKCDVYYNSSLYKLEDTYELLYGALRSKFENKQNLIIQSNCFNLWTFLTFLKGKVQFKSIFSMHCVPFREVARADLKKYKEVSKVYEDETKDFHETLDHLNALNFVDQLIMLSEDSIEYLHRADVRTPFELIRNCSMPIPVGEKKPGKYRFCFVGHSSPLKGMDQLLEIIKDVASENSDFEVHWAGNVAEAHKKIIQENSLPVFLYGVLDTNGMIQFYQNMDCTLIASVCETSPMIVHESLAAGLAIIAGNAPGVRELVKDTGILIDSDYGILDAKQFAASMKKVITDAYESDKLKTLSKKKYAEFSKESMTAKTVNLYKRLVNF